MKAWLEEYGMIIVGIIVVAGLVGLAIWSTKRGKDSSVDVVTGFTNRGTQILNNNSIPTSLEGFTMTEWELAGYLDTGKCADPKNPTEEEKKTQFTAWATDRGYTVGANNALTKTTPGGGE